MCRAHLQWATWGEQECQMERDREELPKRPPECEHHGPPREQGSCDVATTQGGAGRGGEGEGQGEGGGEPMRVIRTPAGFLLATSALSCYYYY